MIICTGKCPDLLHASQAPTLSSDFHSGLHFVWIKQHVNMLVLIPRIQEWSSLWTSYIKRDVSVWRVRAISSQGTCTEIQAVWRGDGIRQCKSSQTVKGKGEKQKRERWNQRWQEAVVKVRRKRRSGTQTNQGDTVIFSWCGQSLWSAFKGFAEVKWELCRASKLLKTGKTQAWTKIFLCRNARKKREVKWEAKHTLSWTVWNWTFWPLLTNS